MNRLKKLFLAGAAGLLAGTALFGMTALAYDSDEDKPIRSVSFTINGVIYPEGKFGEEDLEITTSGGKYEFDHYDVENTGFHWTEDDTPILTVYLAAADKYYFRITRESQIRVNGATYMSAAREDECYTLAVKVKMPSLQYMVGEIENVYIDYSGMVTWEAPYGAGGYEVKFMRNGTTLGGIQKAEGTSFDGGDYLVKASTNYHCMVRALNKKDPTIKSHWVDSNSCLITDEQADAKRKELEEKESLGEWEAQDGKWRFRLPEGEYMAGDWRKIRGKWYYFDNDGFMLTGWIPLGDKWYYFDPEDGHMWANTTTPDGYELSIDGSYSDKELPQRGMYK